MGTLSFKEKTGFAQVLSQGSNPDLPSSKPQLCSTLPKTFLRSPFLLSPRAPFLPVKPLVTALLLQNKHQ